jgi:serine/threonine protein kinase/formylglycine-generating enzyme required for sulfatase activity
MSATEDTSSDHSDTPTMFARRRVNRVIEQALPGNNQLEPGQHIGPFVLTRFLARGGMGQVWVAQDQEIRRAVALKLVLPERVDERTLALFAREARAGGRAAHRNLVSTLAYGTTDDGLSWIAQELVEGSWTLKDCIDDLHAEESMPKGYYGHLAELIAQVAEGVHSAHLAGVIHRDLKPQNILIAPDDTPKVTDFGLARVSDDSFRSVEGEIAGTWAYMSPEQVTAKRMGLDHRTDVFSLGIVLYEMLTLRRPFEGDTTHQIAEQIIAVDPPDPSKLRSQCPRELAVICRKALEKLPANRYETAEAFAQDLRRHLNNEPILAKPPGVMRRCAKWAIRHRAISAAGAVGMVSLLVVSVMAIANSRLARSEIQQRERSSRLSALPRFEYLVDSLDGLWPALPQTVPAFREWESQAEDLLAEMEEHREYLTDAVVRSLPAGGAAGSAFEPQLEELDEALRFGRDELLSPGVATLQHGWSLSRRLEFARRLEEGFEEGGEYAKRWDACLTKLSSTYTDLDLQPQVGLLPIGQDPHSGLWEFAHLASGIPAERDEGGELILTESTGIVLVLIPSGTFEMGSPEPEIEPTPSEESDSPRDPVPETRPDEWPLHEVEVSPFFLSKFEMTQGQWLHLTGSNPSTHSPKNDNEFTLLNPVDSVSWLECEPVLAQHELSFPTEAQWEYGCRGGTSTPWSFGGSREGALDPSTGLGKVNIADKASADEGLTSSGVKDWPIYDDGFARTAPVGSFAPNGFGLYEVHGNLWEWCLDTPYDYVALKSPPLDPIHLDLPSSNRMYRGGSYSVTINFSRSARRRSDRAYRKIHIIGVRPARGIER